jgi:hypothetical protein
MLKSVIKSSYYLAPLDRCSVPAPSIAFRVGGWLAIAGQLRGKGRDRVGAAEPGENTGVAELLGYVVARFLSNPATQQPSNRAAGRVSCT